MYATVANMIERFGETQLIRLSQPEDRLSEAVDEPKVETAIADATAVIDSYIRGRYLTPIAAAPAAIIRAACTLARYDLAQGENTDPTEEMRLARKETIAWLEGVSKGHINLDVPTSGSGSEGSGARVSDRPTIFSAETLGDW